MQKVIQFSLNTQVICLGTFNPAIITPDWLEAKRLINSDDLAVCRDTLQAHGKSRLMVFESAWFRLQVLVDQLSISSLDGATPRVADLTAGILSLLPETPVTAFGVNFDAHFKVLNWADYHRFGDFFVPKHPFHKALPKVDDRDASAGLMHLTIAMDSRSREDIIDTDTLSQQKRITIEPSNAVSPGIFFVYNHHVVTKMMPKSETALSDASKAAKFVIDHWDRNFVEAKGVFESLIETSLA